MLAGPPVALDGHRYIDAGLSAAIPFRAALADGATHVVVLRSRRAGESVTPPSRVSGALTGRALRRLSPALETAFRTRVQREREDEALLAQHDADPALEPSILSIRPAPESPVPSRLERDMDVHPRRPRGRAARRPRRTCAP